MYVCVASHGMLELVLEKVSLVLLINCWNTLRVAMVHTETLLKRAGYVFVDVGEVIAMIVFLCAIE